MQQQGWVENATHPDYVFCIGGDGTLLQAVYHLQNSFAKSVFILIKSGALGFYCTFNGHNLLKMIDQIDQYPIRALSMLEVAFNNTKQYVINEVKVVDHTHVLETYVYIDDALLEFFRGSALVFAGRTGSTGYMKSIAGAIVIAKGDIWEMKELAAVNNAVFHTINAPLILDGSNKVSLKKGLKGKHIILDTHSYELIQDQVDIHISELKLKIAYDPALDIPFVKRIRLAFALDHNQLKHKNK